MKYIFLLFILLSGFTVTKCYKDLDENCRNDIYPCLNNLEEFNVTESESYCEEFYYTQKCLDLFSFGIETIDSCNNPEIDIDTANQWIFAKSVLFRFICSVDEQGKRCPIIKLWDDIYGEKGKKLPELKVHSLIYDTIVKTCTESEKCSNEFIGFTKSISQIMAKFNIKKRNTDININIPNFKDIDLNMMYMVTNLLQSNECKNKTLQIQNVCSTPHNFSLHKRLTHSQSNFSKACEEALLSYYECSADIVDFNLVALDIVCFYFKTEKCQNFIKNGINTIPECKNEDNDLIEWSNIFLKINYFTNNFYCAKLENTNRYCPIIEWICEGSEVDGNKTYENSHYTVAFKDTCQSRVCYDAIINYNKELKQYRKEMNKYNTFFVDPSIMKRNVYPNNNTYYRISPEELFKEAVISLPKECNDTTTRKNNDDLNTKAINLNDNNTLTNHAHSIYHNLTYIFITILLSVLFEQ